MKRLIKPLSVLLLFCLCFCFTGCFELYGSEAQKARDRDMISERIGVDFDRLTLVSEDWSRDFQGWGHYALVYDLNGSDVAITPGGEWSDENPAPREVDALASQNGLQIYADEEWHYVWFYRVEESRYKYSALYDTETGILYVYFDNM